MLTASILLFVIALLGAFDVFYFHSRTCGLTHRPESRREVWLHVARGFIYAAQMVVVPNVVFAGAWVVALALLFALDVVIAMADVLEEPRSRASQGGLPRGEYLAHIVLSVLVGAMLREIAVRATAWIALPSSITWSPAAPLVLRAALGILALGSLGVAMHEALELLAAGRPRPVHVAVILRAPLAHVWELTNDCELHPLWDHRFSKITLLGKGAVTGAHMLYEKRLACFSIRGEGRYKLSRPMRQTTFAFSSSDALSLIREGVGLWLYEPLAFGRVRFSTSYTYAVRWGLFGRLVDRFVFRPLFQRETERSFARLAKDFFGQAATVAGAKGRKPAHFVDSEGAPSIVANAMNATTENA